MATDERAVIAQMLAAGIDEAPEGRCGLCKRHHELLADGRMHRFGAKQRGWYRIHEHFTTVGRRRFLAGTFGYWGRVDSTRIVRDDTELSEADREACRRRAAERAERDRRERAQRQAAAANRSRALWASAATSGSSPYLERKGLSAWAECVRYLADGTLIVPMIRYDKPRAEALVGVQRIAPDGEKRYSKDVDKAGAAVRLGRVIADQPILICEGYATGLTIRAATKRRLPVFVAFDAGGLLLVGHVVRKNHPDAVLLFCADDDYLTVRTRRGETTNPGMTRSFLAARELGNAHCCRPVWSTRRSDKRTDFDDMRQDEGLEAVASLLDRVLARLDAIA